METHQSKFSINRQKKLKLIAYSEEADSLDIPWIAKGVNSKTKVFTGFEDASTDDVNELTKVVTSHILYIDVLGSI